MRTASIYLIRNSINKKIYIGSAVFPLARWRQHVSNLVAGRHTPSFVEDWRKFGSENWQFVVLEDKIPANQRFLVEQAYLDKYRPFEPIGYNMARRCNTPLLVDNTKVLSREERLKALSELLHQGISYRAVARSQGISLGLVAKVAAESGLGRAFEYKILEDEEVCRVAVELRESGMTSSAISAMLAVTTEDLYKIWKITGLTKKINSAVAERVYELRAGGQSMRGISKSLKISTTTVHKVLHGSLPHGTPEKTPPPYREHINSVTPRNWSASFR